MSAVMCRPGPAFAAGAAASALLDQASKREAAGDLDGARSLLEQAQTNGQPDAAATLAEFLDRHHSPDRRAAFLRWAKQETDSKRRLTALQQVVLTDFMEDRRSELSSDLQAYRTAGGADFQLPSKLAPDNLYSSASIPGPLSSFARMAALSPDLAPEELFPALARNIVTNGYQAISSSESLQPTEYLRLLTRYIGQARELQIMSGSAGKIVIPNCDSEQTGELLKVLGYRMRGSCGADIVLETVNPSRAFLTVDSGFPLAELEADLRGNHRFELPYSSTRVPVLYNASYWLSALGREKGSDFLDGFISDPSLCRLYLGLSRVDRPTADALRKQASAARLKLYAHVLDFYGSMFQVREGAAVVPGSPRTWASLVGTSPSNGGAFFDRLIADDDGWMASYFDALSRIEGPTAAYLTAPERTRRFYEALKGKVTTPGPARPVFRSSTELMLLTTSLRMNADGTPHIPGSLDLWRQLFIKHPHGKYDGKLTRSANGWKNDDDVLEALFALSRKTVENEPLKIFLTLNDIDRGRSQPLSPATATRLAFSYRTYGAQYTVFADHPALSEKSINGYMDVLSNLNSIRDSAVKADAVGSVEALVGIWQILCRQGSVAADVQDASFRELINPFGEARQATEVFDGARAGVNTLLTTTHMNSSSTRQDRLVTLLVGENHGTAEHPTSADNFLRIYDAQRLLPVDTLFTAVDQLSKGGTANSKAIRALTNQFAQLNEAQGARNALSSEERNMLALGYWSERHIDAERKVNLDNIARNPDKKDARAALEPFLRDSLVGLLYSYYAPPGAQILLTNQSFVRSHDFVGAQSLPMEWRVTEVTGSGWPTSAGGRLMGSLIALPYALAEAEQNFLTPSREQALIWGDLVPQIIVNSTVTRWRNVNADQLRWVALHMERGRDLLAMAALNPKQESAILSAFARYATPARVELLRDRLHATRFNDALMGVQPSELFALAEDQSLLNTAPDVASLEMTQMQTDKREDLQPARIASIFGSPKPTLLHSYQPALLHLRTFPTLMGYSSRILAETWESDNLFYAALADEIALPADQLDNYIPEWTRSTIENIFATHLEDWPALLRSLNLVGQNVRTRSTERASIQ